MKALIRWAYMKAFHSELMEVKKYAQRNLKGLGPKEGLTRCGQVEGAIQTLETLDLLVRV